MAENTDDDPWAALRNASQKPEAGRFAYEESAPERARASAWDWIKFWLRVEVVGWLKKQFPLASRSLDSSYYLGITRQKKTTAHVVKMALGKESEKEISRTPIVIMGRRIGTPGLVLGSFIVIVFLAIFRHAFGF